MRNSSCLGIVFVLALSGAACSGPELRLPNDPTLRSSSDAGIAAGEGGKAAASGRSGKSGVVPGSSDPGGGANSGGGGTGSGIASGGVPVGAAGFASRGSGGFSSGGTIPSGGAGFSGPGGPNAKCDSSGTCYYPDGTVCYPGGKCCGPMGCGAIGSGGTIAPPPVTNEPWVPPVAAGDVGAPGWKSSTAPLCLEGTNSSVFTYSVWSDGRGVFAAPVSSDNTGSNPSCPGCPSENIFLNVGNGWVKVPGTPFGAQQLMKGFDHGPLVLYGYSYETMMKSPMGSSCGLALLADGVRACEAVDGVSDVSVVASNLAYGLLQGSVIRYDGSHWGPLPVAFPAQAQLMNIWADASVVMATASNAGTIYSLRDGAWKVEDTRTLETFAPIWGFSGSDVWAGTYQGGLFHYDGNAWNQISWSGTGCANDASIHGLWGAGGNVYIYGANVLARWDGSKVETIAQWSCDSSGQGAATISSVWGNSATEVFIGILDPRRAYDKCGSAFVLYYDGKLFHRM